MVDEYLTRLAEMLVYVNAQRLAQAETLDFATFYMNNAADLSSEVGYIPLPKRAYELAQQRLRRRVTGTMFDRAGSQVGIRIDQLLELQQKE